MSLELFDQPGDQPMRIESFTVAVLAQAHKELVARFELTSHKVSGPQRHEHTLDHGINDFIAAKSIVQLVNAIDIEEDDPAGVLADRRPHEGFEHEACVASKPGIQCQPPGKILELVF